MEQNNQKVISVCIIGKPNAGKSTLLNNLVGQKISIVTPKVQTTRTVITGITTIENTQIIILDTPGIFEPKKTQEKDMVRCAWSSVHSADLVMLIIDSTKRIDDSTIKIFKQLSDFKLPIVVLLNKVDLLSKSKLHEFKSDALITLEQQQIFEISALRGNGISDLTQYLISKASTSHWLYDADDITTTPSRLIASEITREQLFLQLQQELPYNLGVHTETWEEKIHHKNKQKSIMIRQAIVVARDSYKTIILGKHGSRIKEIGIKARAEMEEFFECKIHLFLFVKVRELWYTQSL